MRLHHAAEGFITKLVFRHAHLPLTPDDAQRILEEFRLDIDDAVSVTKRFQQQYPDKTRPAAPNAE